MDLGYRGLRAVTAMTPREPFLPRRITTPPGTCVPWLLLLHEQPCAGTSFPHPVGRPSRFRAVRRRVHGGQPRHRRPLPVRGILSRRCGSVVTAKGTRFFVKAVPGSLNSESPRLHRREARIMNLLPAGLPTPRLVGTHDDGEWVALVFSDVDGRHPQLSGTDLRAVLGAVDAISARPLSPEALEVLPSLTDEVRDIFGGWARLRKDPHTGLGPWALQHHALLESLSATAADTVGGDRLVHVDLRADNVLIDRDGRAVIVDWPWAAHGASWFDALTLLVDARVNDPGCDAESALREHAVFASAGPQQVDSVLAALAGYFLDNARKPSPPGLPTLRAFQLAEGAACLGWLRERLERPDPALMFGERPRLG